MRERSEIKEKLQREETRKRNASKTRDELEAYSQLTREQITRKRNGERRDFPRSYLDGIIFSNLSRVLNSRQINGDQIISALMRRVTGIINSTILSESHSDQELCRIKRVFDSIAWNFRARDRLVLRPSICFIEKEMENTYSLQRASFPHTPICTII